MPHTDDPMSKLTNSKKRAAIGIRAHSGWAAVVAVAGDSGEVRVIDRRRIIVVDSDGPRAKQPYHFAENLPLGEAQSHLDRCDASTSRVPNMTHANLPRALGPLWRSDEVLGVRNLEPNFDMVGENH